jgi:hypothetical protein
MPSKTPPLFDVFTTDEPQQPMTLSAMKQYDDNIFLSETERAKLREAQRKEWRNFLFSRYLTIDNFDRT